MTSIGCNLRITAFCSKGGRKYMEDYFSVAYQQSPDGSDLEFAYFGIFDGHGGNEASKFAKEHLMNHIVNLKGFWSDDDEDVKKAIREGFLSTHHAMWKDLDKWPKTNSGLPSTAGTTASIAFIRRGKIYIGHCGDSGIVLGKENSDGRNGWVSQALTVDHKPESEEELSRITSVGGKVINKGGVHRVVWNRAKYGHKGPIRRSTPIDEIPFLAVARSLGDLWSYNPRNDEFVVSPEPDVSVVKIDSDTFKCLIFGTDGLWNMMSSADSVDIVRSAEMLNDANINDGNTNEWKNPSRCLVDEALDRWQSSRMRADNTSVVTIMLDRPNKKNMLKICRSPQTTLAENAESDSDDDDDEDDEEDEDDDENGEEVESCDLTISETLIDEVTESVVKVEENIADELIQINEISSSFNENEKTKTLKAQLAEISKENNNNNNNKENSVEKTLRSSVDKKSSRNVSQPTQNYRKIYVTRQMNRKTLPTSTNKNMAKETSQRRISKRKVAKVMSEVKQPVTATVIRKMVNIVTLVTRNQQPPKKQTASKVKVLIAKTLRSSKNIMKPSAPITEKKPLLRKSRNQENTSVAKSKLRKVK
ncbi:unnamed protein product [Diamesa tonsa]